MILVHSYDLYDSQLTRAFGRSLLREGGHLVYMAERKNAAHRQILKRLTRRSTSTDKWTTTLRGSPGSSIPPDTKDTIESYASDTESENPDNQTIRSPLTGATLSLDNATVALYRYSSQSFRDVRTSTPLFEYEELFDTDPVMYRCRVLLPDHKIIDTWGPPKGSRRDARRSASFTACSNLYNAGLLDHRYFPFPGVLISAPTKASLVPQGQNFTGTRSYVKQVPRFWSSSPTNILFPTILRVEGSAALPRHAPILLLCFQPLPTLPTFNLFISGAPYPLRIQNARPITVDSHQAEELRSYTLRVWSAIRNKRLTCPTDKIPYYLAPFDWDAVSAKNCETHNFPDISNAIHWDSISLAAKNYADPLKFGDHKTVEEDTRDALIMDRHVEFTRRYEPVAVRSDLTPLSLPPSGIAVCLPTNTEGLPPITFPQAGNKYDSMSFLDFCKAHRMKFDGLKDEHQAMLEVKPAPAFLDPLNPSGQLKYSTETHRSTFAIFFFL